MGWAKIIAYAFVLGGKSVTLLGGFFLRRSKGVEAFRRELLACGLSGDEAEALSQCYKNLLPLEWKTLLQAVKGGGHGRSGDGRQAG